uniref:Actin maturation protease n=1 Tax=Aquila chrysaetos chrysaetos TaxID=223781 RepID=A0A663FI30_AQUCH
MAASLLAPTHGVGLEELVGTARERGFTARGEMFSAADMAALAEELFPCRAELLSGGLEGSNRPRILRHLLGGLPLLVPYDEDSNHEPCCRRGHKAHWAVLTGVLLGIRSEALSPSYRQDPEIPNLFHPPSSWFKGDGTILGGGEELFGGDTHPIEGVLVLAQQGKSPRCQLWGFGGASRQQCAAEGAEPPPGERRPPLRPPPGGAGGRPEGEGRAAAPPNRGGAHSPPPQ